MHTTASGNDLLNGCGGNQSGLVSTIGDDEGFQYRANLLVVLDEVADAAECIVYQSLILLPKVIEHHIERILQIGDLPRDCLGLLFHEVVELASAGGHRNDSLLHLRESYLALAHHLVNLFAGSSELFLKLLNQWDASTAKLEYVAGIQSPL